MRVAVLALLVTVIGTSADAFTAAPGFSAVIYASGVTAPAGLTFVGGTLYAVDPSDGGLYRAPAGASPLTATRIATLGGAPTGIAALGGLLYVTRAASSDVVRVDPATGAILATVATSADIPCASSLAADPVTGDLLVTSCDALWRIATPSTTPVVTRYTGLFPGGTATYGITITADDTIYVTAPAIGQVWRIQGPTQAAGAPPVRGPVGYVIAPRGVALIGSFLFVSSGDGTLTKVPLPELGGPNVTALSGDGAGDQASLGPDGCFYASEGASVVRLGDALGGCALAAAAPPPPPPSLTLLNTSTIPPLVGIGEETFIATLANVASPGGVSVTFSVTGANAQTHTTTIGLNGTASFAYSPASIGIDTIVAVATVSGVPLTSNALTVTWTRAYDAARPTITYAVSGTHGPSFGCPRAGVGTPGITEYCGWFTTPPTITWSVTANGPTGIDASRTICPSLAIVGVNPIGGTLATCEAFNGDGVRAALQVFLLSIATPPTVTASATTADGAVYVAGTPVAQAVTVTFACDSAYGAAGVASCTAPITVTTSAASVSGSVVDIAGVTRSAVFGPIVITTQSTTLAIVSPPFVAEGGAVRARLVGMDGVTPVVGRTVTFAAGGATASRLTNGEGIATASFGLASGQYALTASFAGDPAYYPSRATQGLTIYATTRFVVWGANFAIGASVQLYGSDWAKQIPDRDERRLLDHFKGYADTAGGGTWTGRTGDKVKAPATIARYVGVIVTSSATRSGERVAGTVDRVAIVRVEGNGKKPYDGRVGDAVFGTVLGVGAP